MRPFNLPPIFPVQRKAIALRGVYKYALKQRVINMQDRLHMPNRAIKKGTPLTHNFSMLSRATYIVEAFG